MSANPVTLWTPEEIAELRRLHAQVPPLSYTEIAKELGRKRNACIGKAHRLDLPDRTEMKNHGRPVTTKPSTSGVKRRMGPVSPARIEDAQRARTAKPGEAPARPVLVGNQDGCQWPTGDHPFVFCGSPVDRGQVYCGTHCRLAYRPKAPRSAAAGRAA